jgi:hypothetical protein
MKYTAIVRSFLVAESLVLAVAVLAASSSFAQERIYRCGNEYTNNPKEAKNGGCKLVEGGNVTVIQGSRPPAGTPVKVATASSSPNGGQRVDSTEQRTRDSDSRGILEAELKKAEAKQADLLKEYNNGEPEKQGPETKNHQKYLDRVAEMKASIARNDSDIAGIKRELGRNTSSAVKAN